MTLLLILIALSFSGRKTMARHGDQLLQVAGQENQWVGMCIYFFFVIDFFTLKKWNMFLLI